jgi:hypothetical protein
MMETRMCAANGTPLVVAAAVATYDNTTKQSSSLRLLNDRTIEVSPCVYRPWGVLMGRANGSTNGRGVHEQCEERERPCCGGGNPRRFGGGGGRARRGAARGGGKSDRRTPTCTARRCIKTDNAYVRRCSWGRHRHHAAAGPAPQAHIAGPFTNVRRLGGRDDIPAPSQRPGRTHKLESHRRTSIVYFTCYYVRKYSGEPDRSRTRSSTVQTQTMLSRVPSHSLPNTCLSPNHPLAGLSPPKQTHISDCRNGILLGAPPTRAASVEGGRPHRRRRLLFLAAPSFSSCCCRRHRPSGGIGRSVRPNGVRLVSVARVVPPRGHPSRCSEARRLIIFLVFVFEDRGCGRG